MSIVAHVELKLDVGYFFTTQAVVTIDSHLDFFTQRVTCFVKSYQKRTGLLLLAKHLERVLHAVVELLILMQVASHATLARA